MVDMDCSKVGLPRFHVQNEMSQPPQEEISNLEATINEMKIVHFELAPLLAHNLSEISTLYKRRN